jgi:hypothetical protein
MIEHLDKLLRHLFLAQIVRFQTRRAADAFGQVSGQPRHRWMATLISPFFNASLS